MMSSLRCKFGIHAWTKWGAPVKGYSKLNQFRECARCGVLVSQHEYHDQISPELAILSRDSGLEKGVVDG